MTSDQGELDLKDLGRLWGDILNQHLIKIAMLNRNNAALMQEVQRLTLENMELKNKLTDQS